MSHARHRLLAAGTAVLTGLAGLTLAPSSAQGTSVAAAPKDDTPATSRGYGGAVSSVDLEASKIGLGVLKRGGNAVDAAVATAAALGVTEPYSSGIGGGGYFVHYDARTGKVETIDGRETAPKAMPHDAFIDPKTGEPYNFTPELVTSGVSVGTPGTLATWDTALRKWGKGSLADALKPAAKLADRGFKVDKTFNLQTTENKRRFANFPASSKLFLPGGEAPAVGSTLRNPDLAATYRLIAKRGANAFYGGPLAKEIARTAQHPPKRANPDLPIPPGYLTAGDLARYRVKKQAPTHVGYRGLDVYGMAPSSSGGSTVGEALNILERFRLRGMSDADALHHYLEASALAYADRGKYVGDPAYVKVPLRDLLSDKYAAERACSIDPDKAATKPVEAGDVEQLRRPLRRVDRTPERQARHREREHHQPHRRRPVGQHRGVHAHHRADRWLRHRRARSRLPAQQRAHRLHRGLRPEGPQPDRGRQAAALVDLADDRAAQRQAGAGSRLTRRVDDHHDRPADAVQPVRPRDEHRGRDRGAAGRPAQHAPRSPPSRPSSTSTAPR